MPRPCKRRRICQMPRCERFAPTEKSGGALQLVTMSLDEYETIRLIDLLGMTQLECAAQMNIARSTAQAIYNSTRAKLAEFLVNGRELSIAGGEYILCEGNAKNDCCSRSCRCCHKTSNDTTH